MKTIGSHPGAILFRLSIMVILIAIFVVVFFHYVGRVQAEAERAAILRTKGLIDSSLAVVFATYATQSRINDLNDLHAANPFEFLADYQMLPGTYKGAIDHSLKDSLEPGWYFLDHLGQVAYKPRYLDEDYRFEVKLKYVDKNESGLFESEADSFQGVYFEPVVRDER